jgi:O-antigen biosynthesis protein
MLRLHPLSGIEGAGPRWHAEAQTPWFALEGAEALAGRWVRLVWEAGLADPLFRPVLRAMTDAGPQDQFLPAAPFGRQSWIGHLPEGLRALWLSPVDGAGDFGFALVACTPLGRAQAFSEALRRSPGLAVHAGAAALIGRRADARLLLAEALAGHPLAQYAGWRRAGERAWDVAGVDGPLPPAGAPHLRLVLPAGDPAHEQALRALVSALPGAASLHVASGDPLLTPQALEGLAATDLVMTLPPGSTITPQAVHALRAAALRAPATLAFFGDGDHEDGAGRHARPVFRPAPDPLAPLPCEGPLWGVARRVFTVLAPVPLHPAEALFRVVLTLPRASPAIGPRFPPVEPRPAGGEEAAIILPTRDHVALLQACVESIRRETAGPYRIVVLDNDSRQAKTRQYLESLPEDPRITVHAVGGPFNFSHLCNIGAGLVTSPVLVFLNNDTVVLDAGWLQALVGLALRPDVGAVGAKLLYPSGRVQHNGVVAGLGGRAGHFETGLLRDDPGFFGRADRPHTLMAVTGACLAVEHRKFDEVGGFDAENLPVDLNDIDLCLRLRAHGYATVIDPGCVLIHHESASRGKSGDTARRYAGERRYFSARWLREIRQDPSFHPALCLYGSRPRLG